MSTFSRIASIVRAKITSLLDNLENPIENLEAAWQKQMELLYKLKDSLHNIRTSRQLLEGQKARIIYNLKRSSCPHYLDPASALKQIKILENEINELRSKEKQLDFLLSELKIHIGRFNNHKDILESRYYAAKTVCTAESPKSSDKRPSQEIKHLLEELSDSVSHLEAKAAAIDELTGFNE